MVKTIIDNNKEDFKDIQKYCEYIDNPEYILGRFESLSKRENFYRVEATEISEEDSNLIDCLPSVRYECDIDGRTYYFMPSDIPCEDPLDLLIEKKGDILILRGGVYWYKGRLFSQDEYNVQFYSKNKLRLDFIEKQTKDFSEAIKYWDFYNGTGRKDIILKTEDNLFHPEDPLVSNTDYNLIRYHGGENYYWECTAENLEKLYMFRMYRYPRLSGTDSLRYLRDNINYWNYKPSLEMSKHRMIVSDHKASWDIWYMFRYCRDMFEIEEFKSRSFR